ncbi:MAG: transposase [Planctomycetota bacterium]|nr:transposase [Planctomycetota bacterium]
MFDFLQKSTLWNTYNLSLTATLADRLHDQRDQRFVRYPMAKLTREDSTPPALGLSRQDDADRLAHDPAFRTAVWDRPGCEAADERLASQPTASRLVSLLAGWHNRGGLRQFLHQPVLRHQRQSGSEQRVVPSSICTCE